jgi:hypothetical protein
MILSRMVLQGITTYLLIIVGIRDRAGPVLSLPFDWDSCESLLVGWGFERWGLRGGYLLLGLGLHCGVFFFFHVLGRVRFRRTTDAKINK